MALSQKIIDKMNAFRASTAPLVFKCIKDRNAFINDLKDRCNDPTNIAQEETSLCGPAAFMYCIAHERPNEYAEYVLDLASTGKAYLGNMEVAPKRNLSKPLSGDSVELPPAQDVFTAGIDRISPVDWVALASLRDASNYLFRMGRSTAEAAGITDGGTLANWFKKTGWFKDVRDDSSNGRKMPMNNLLGINGLPASYVCLLVNQTVITNPNNIEKDFLGNTPNHWVVLDNSKNKNSIGTNKPHGSKILAYDPRQSNYSYPAVFPGGDFDMTFNPALVGDGGAEAKSRYLDERNNKYRDTEKQQLNIEVYSWGQERLLLYPHLQNPLWPINTTIETFLKGYFGFVSAAH